MNDIKSKIIAQEDINGKFMQLCWNCERVKNASCKWTSKLRPVSGWDATLVKNSSDNRETYAIFSCPELVPIKSGKFIHCEHCGKEFYSYGNPLCSYDCYKAYEEEHGKAYVNAPRYKREKVI